MKKISKECLICKEYFDKPKNCSLKEWIGSKKYCSKKCYSQAQKLGLHKNALGYKHTEETKKHLSEIHTGKSGYWLGKKRWEGKIHPSIGRKRLDITGEKNCNWKGGVTPENQKLRHSIEYNEWRRKCFERDNYTCQICNKRGVYLEVHHIEGWSINSQLRYELSNGQTLCKICHGLIDNSRFRLLKTMEKQIYGK